MNGEHCVKKSQTPFTEIGIDHSGEQVIKTLKIEGGLVICKWSYCSNACASEIICKSSILGVLR